MPAQDRSEAGPLRHGVPDPGVVVPVPGEAGQAPVGVQIVGRHGSDPSLLELADHLQSHLDWLSCVPPVFAR